MLDYTVYLTPRVFFSRRGALGSNEVLAILGRCSDGRGYGGRASRDGEARFILVFLGDQLHAAFEDRAAGPVSVGDEICFDVNEAQS